MSRRVARRPSRLSHTRCGCCPAAAGRDTGVAFAAMRRAPDPRRSLRRARRARRDRCCRAPRARCPTEAARRDSDSRRSEDAWPLPPGTRPSTPRCCAGARGRRAAAPARRCPRRAWPSPPADRSRRTRAAMAARAQGTPRQARRETLSPSGARLRAWASALTCAQGSIASSWPATHRSRGSVATSTRARSAWSSNSLSCCQREGGADGGSVSRLPVWANARATRQQGREGVRPRCSHHAVTRTGTCAAAPSRPAACA